jgi:hypothetical protein
MKKKTSITTLVLVYMGFFAIQVAILPASVISFIPLVITAAVGYWHTHKAHVWNTKVEWSHINRPFAIIDWGPEGKAFELPEHHSGFYIACSSKNVADTVAYVQYSLSQSGNQAFIRSQLPVLEFRYRYGKAHWNETADEYRERVIKEFDYQVGEWHGKLEKDKLNYIKSFFADNENGSAPE